MKNLTLNKGDLILLVILAATAALYGLNEWNIVHGFQQWDSGAWTTWSVLFGGELMAFSLKKIGEAMAASKDGGKAAKHMGDEKEQ